MLRAGQMTQKTGEGESAIGDDDSCGEARGGGAGSHRALRKGAKKRSLPNCHPHLEQLEPRLALTASLVLDDNLLLTHGGICSCPICSGRGLENLVAPQLATTTAGSSSTSGATRAPLTSLPQLSSNSSARVKLFLDFDGNFEASWGSYRNVTTRVFDQDGDATTFSTAELDAIREIWARVAEDYAPFNVDVTTISPASFGNGQAVRMAIGGNYTDWFGQGAGGVAYVGGFTNSASNVGYIFEDALANGNARYVAEAVSHEAGHLFGLWHQSTYANGQLQQEYNPGNSAWAPIMGVGYYSSRTTWHNGPNDNGPNSYQDDISILAGATNGFGLRGDDYGGTIQTPSNLAVTGTSVNVAGLIGSSSDLDVFRFTTSGGVVNLQLNVAQFGANLDAALELRNATGQTLVLSDPTNSLGGTITTTLAAGTYFVVVRPTGTYGSGAYGNLGQYTLTGSIGGAGATTGGGATGSGGGTTGGNTTTSTVRIIDNGAAGHSVTGSWRQVTGQGREGDIHTAARSTRGVTATSTWTFSSLPSGTYRVWLTWTTAAGNATNGPLAIRDGNTLRAVLAINQTQAASGLNAEGTSWRMLTNVTVVSGTLSVQLGNLANGNIVADAVRIERISAASALLENDALGGGSTSDDDGSGLVAFDSSRQGGSQGNSSLSGSLLGRSSSPAGLNAERHAELFSRGSDCHGELSLLEDTLDLLDELSSFRRAGSSDQSGEKGSESLLGDDAFALQENWLSIGLSL